MDFFITYDTIVNHSVKRKFFFALISESRKTMVVEACCGSSIIPSNRDKVVRRLKTCPQFLRLKLITVEHSFLNKGRATLYLFLPQAQEALP